MNEISTGRRFTALFLSVALTAGSVVVHAQEGGKPAAPAPGATPAPDSSKVDEARKRYDRGLKLFEEENYDAACLEFKRAYDLAPIYRILYNIGLCHKQKNDYVAALRTLEQYLKEGGAEVPADRQAAVTKTIGEIKPLIGFLTITVNVANAEVMIDDVSVGKSPLKEPVMVNPGRRKVSATQAGRFPATQSVEVAGSETVKVSLELGAVPVTRETVTVRSNIAPYIAWGVTGLLAVGAGVSGYVAIRTANKQDDLLATPNANPNDLSDNRASMRRWAVLTDVLVATTLVAAGVSIFITLKSSKSEEPKPTPTAAAATSLKLGVGPTGFTLLGTF